MNEFNASHVGTEIVVNGVKATITRVDSQWTATVTANGRSWQVNSAMRIELASTRYALRGTV
jgi:hypothetical protein